MMRRLKFYIMCLLLGVSILIIIDTLRCTNDTNSSTYYKNVLEDTRSQIKRDTYDYNFSQSKVSELKNLVMEDGGQPLRSLIISTWRSGSTFLGDLVTNVFPSTYYTCEPLLMYDYKQFWAPKEVSEALSLVKRILKCDYEGSEDYFDFIRNFLDGNIAQLKILNVGHYKSTALQYSQNCKNEKKEDLCYNAEFNSQLCKLYPFQSMKTVRLRLKHIEEVLNDQALNVKVILLVRDPRGVMQSRLHDSDCMLSPDCSNPALLCDNMVSDYKAAGRLLQQYPDQLIVMRFEELALQPNVTSDKMLSFLNAARSQAFDKFLQSHTKVEEPGYLSTSRVSRNVPYKWKTALEFKYVSEIQIACREAMRLWGYKMARNETHMTSDNFDPVDDYTIS